MSVTCFKDTMGQSGSRPIAETTQEFKQGNVIQRRLTYNRGLTTENEQDL